MEFDHSDRDRPGASPDSAAPGSGRRIENARDGDSGEQQREAAEENREIAEEERAAAEAARRTDEGLRRMAEEVRTREEAARLAAEEAGGLGDVPGPAHTTSAEEGRDALGHALEGAAHGFLSLRCLCCRFELSFALTASSTTSTSCCFS